MGYRLDHTLWATQPTNPKCNNNDFKIRKKKKRKNNNNND